MERLASAPLVRWRCPPGRARRTTPVLTTNAVPQHSFGRIARGANAQQLHRPQRFAGNRMAAGANLAAVLAILQAVIGALRSALRTPASLVAENLVLRHAESPPAPSPPESARAACSGSSLASPEGTIGAAARETGGRQSESGQAKSMQTPAAPANGPARARWSHQVLPTRDASSSNGHLSAAERTRARHGWLWICRVAPASSIRELVRCTCTPRDRSPFRRQSTRRYWSARPWSDRGMPHRSRRAYDHRIKKQIMRARKSGPAPGVSEIRAPRR